MEHTVPACDDWFDDLYVKRLGESNDMEAVVDRVPIAGLVSVRPPPSPPSFTR